jgi:hypothetical protein
VGLWPIKIWNSSSSTTSIAVVTTTKEDIESGKDAVLEQAIAAFQQTNYYWSKHINSLCLAPVI